MDRLTARTGHVVAGIVEVVEDTEGAHSGSHSRIAAAGAAGAAVDGDIRHGAERTDDSVVAAAAAAAAAALAGSDSVEGKCRMAAPGASHRDMSWHLSIGKIGLLCLRVAVGVNTFVHRQ